ncbi:apolipoprotein L6 isoform X4 [Trachypithecus francoisi]|nr:apolipoprotein L6 isoform X4 [Trachypithecus francoisi]
MSRIRNTLPPACQENHLTPGDTDLVPQRLLDNQAEKESEAGVDLKRDEEDVPLCEDVELQDRDLSPEEKIFLKEFPRLKADIEGNINKLRALAEDVDKTHKKFTKANIVVNSTGVICEAMSLLGFAFAPVTGGVSLLLSTTGQGLAAAAGLTSIVSGMLEKSENKKAQAQAEDILPTHDQEDREDEENRADYVTAAAQITYKGVNTLEYAKKNIHVFQKLRADPRLASASKRLLTTGQVSSQSSKQIQKAFGETLRMTKNARLRGGVMSIISLGFDWAALSKEWKHLKEGARTKFAEELRAKASELERKLTLLTEYYKSLQQKAGVQWMISAHCNLCLLSASNSPASASQVAGIPGIHHHTQLISVFLVETGFHHFGQAGLEFLTSSGPATLASQSAGITGMSHQAQPDLPSFNKEVTEPQGELGTKLSPPPNSYVEVLNQNVAVFRDGPFGR